MLFFLSIFALPFRSALFFILHLDMPFCHSFMRYLKSSSSFFDSSEASRILKTLRLFGPDKALHSLRSICCDKTPLLYELNQRLLHKPSPRLLIDGLWHDPTVALHVFGGRSLILFKFLDLFPPISPSVLSLVARLLLVVLLFK